MPVEIILNDGLTAQERVYVRQVSTLVPIIREDARASEEGRRVTDRVMKAAKEAELFSALVPVRWGGQGLGLRALAEGARTLAHGDASSAWALAFLIEHNWMAGRLPMSVQEQLYADRNSILAAAPLVAGGPAVREADGSYRISGTWRYGTGFDNSDWVFVTCTIEEPSGPVDRVFLLPVDQVEVVQTWEASGMAATSSHNIRGIDIVVPADRSLPISDFVSADSHGGLEHVEAIYHYPLHFGLNNMMAGIFVGIAETVLELYEEKMATSRPFGLARLERTPSRIRWGTTRKRIEAARLLYFATLDRTIAKCDERNGHTQEDIGELQLSSLVIAHMCHEAVNELCKGIGSSAFALSDPIQRYKRDIDVLINHAGMDWDVVADRASRWALGFGAETTDWHSAPAKEAPATGAEQPADERDRNLIDALFAANVDEVIAAIGENGRLDTPRLEPAQGRDSLAELVRNWSDAYPYRVEDVSVKHRIQTPSGTVTETLATLVDGDRTFVLPFAIAESEEDGVNHVRIYHSERLIHGERRGRRPIWPTEPEQAPTPLEAIHPAVAAYMAAIASGEEEAVVARFASDGKLDNGVQPIEDADDLRAIFRAMVRTGGARLVRCREFDDGTTVALEYTGLPRPTAPGAAPRTPPGGGIGVYTYDSDGRIRSVRMYDDFDPDALVAMGNAA